MSLLKQSSILAIGIVLEYQGPVVQSIVSLPSSLRGQVFYDFITEYNIFVEKIGEAFHVFSAENIGIFEIFKFEILTKR